MGRLPLHRCERRHGSRGQPHRRVFFFLFLLASAPPCRPEALASLLTFCHDQNRRTTDEPRRHATMHTVRLDLEFLRCPLLVRCVRLVTGELLVVTTLPASSPSVRSRRSAPPSTRCSRRVGPVDPWGPRVSGHGCTAPGASSK